MFWGHGREKFTQTGVTRIKWCQTNQGHSRTLTRVAREISFRWRKVLVQRPTSPLPPFSGSITTNLGKIDRYCTK